MAKGCLVRAAGILDAGYMPPVSCHPCDCGVFGRPSADTFDPYVEVYHIRFFYHWNIALKQMIYVLTVLQFLAQPASAQTLDGKLVHVRDADTIELATSRGRIPIRLNGVDAPELDERRGRAGKRWMSKAYGGQQLRCVLNGDKTYDRWVAVCYDRDGTDIGAAVIASGLARDCPRFSGGRYRKFETKASRAIPSKPYCK